MPSVINTNIPSLNAQRNLNKTQSALDTALQRLSSGLRINSAKDDAAGLAISTRFTAQINGLNQAARNANDGISLSQTAEGALGEVTNNLQRIRELAVQSANSTNSATDRSSLDAETQQLIAEITRVASQTQFNGIELLDGTFTSQAFQVGANANQTISVNSIADARATALGSNILVMAGTAMNANTAAATAAATTVNGVAAQNNMTLTTANSGSPLTTSPFSLAISSTAAQLATAIDTAAGGIGISATASNSTTLANLSLAGTVTFNLNGSAISAVIGDTSDLTALVGAINGASGTTHVTATFTSTSSKAGLTLTADDGRDIKIDTFASTGAGNQTVNFGSVTLTEGSTNSSIRTGSVSLSSTKGAISAGSTTGGTVFNAVTGTFSSMAGVSLATAASAQLAIATVDAALGQVNVSRGDLGAYQNRFMSAIANLQTTSENLSASRSRILDADFAAETANLTRAQILQQAGTAMLAQANALPNTVLTLLKG